MFASVVRAVFRPALLLAACVLLQACERGGNASAKPVFGSLQAANSVYVYRDDSPWAEELAPCVFVTTFEDACTLERLPFISADGTSPTIDDIMHRLLVSHDWIGARFEEALRAASPDLLRMFGSTTAILIGSEVRPSFYYSLNAAIQLDAAFLWQTLEEKRTVSIAQDFRTDFGRDLRFQFLQRPVVDGQPAVQFFSLSDTTERGFADVEIPLMQLLYHELAHAIDAMPTSRLASVNPQSKALEAIIEAEPESLSQRLAAQMPLSSDTLMQLADVRFRGTPASDEQQQLGASDVGSFLEGEGAMKFYSYLSQREDVATLVESALMKHHYDVTLNMAFADKPADPATAPCEDLLVGWGVRNRLADPQVATRARFLIEEGLGDSVDAEALFGVSLGTAEPMQVGLDWCSNNPEPQQLADGQIDDQVDNRSTSGRAGGTSGATDDWRNDLRLPAGERHAGNVRP